MEGGNIVELKEGSNEVVVSILGSEETSRTSAGSKAFTPLESGSSSISKNIQIGSPEITKSSTTTNTPPKIPAETVTRRKSLARSTYLKPNSRLVEPHYPSNSHLVEESSQLANSSSISRNSPHMASPTNKTNASAPKGSVRTVPITPKTPLMASPGGRKDDDEDVYKTAYLRVAEKWGKRLKVMLSLEWIVFVCIMVVLVASLTVHKLHQSTICSMDLWK